MPPSLPLAVGGGGCTPCCASWHDSKEPCPLPPTLPLCGWWRRLHALLRVTARLDRAMPIAALAASLAHLVSCHGTTRWSHARCRLGCVACTPCFVSRHDLIEPCLLPPTLPLAVGGVACTSCRVSQHSSIEPCPLPPTLPLCGWWRLCTSRRVSQHDSIEPCPLLPSLPLAVGGVWRRRLHALLCVTARLDRAMPNCHRHCRWRLAASLAHLVACHSMF